VYNVLRCGLFAVSRVRRKGSVADNLPIDKEATAETIFKNYSVPRDHSDVTCCTVIGSDRLVIY
jgi:hypothetical protein